MSALLHDARALAVVFTDDDERAAEDTCRGEIGERIGSDIGADGGLPGHRTAQRIIDRRCQHRRRSSLRGARLEIHAKLIENVPGIVQHVHEVRDWSPLVAADVGNAGLQQRLGHSKNRLALELLPCAESQ